MIISFTEPFDIRMHLAALHQMAIVDGQIQNREQAYLKQLAKRYQSILGFDCSIEDICAIRSKDVKEWICSLKKRPCSARNLIRDMVELVWSDGVVYLPEFEKLEKFADQCGVSNKELHLLLNGVKQRHIADAIIADVVEHGNRGRISHSWLKISEDVKESQSRVSDAKALDKELRTKRFLAIAIIVVSFCAIGIFSLFIWVKCSMKIAIGSSESAFREKSNSVITNDVRIPIQIRNNSK